MKDANFFLEKVCFLLRSSECICLSSYIYFVWLLDSFLLNLDCVPWHQLYSRFNGKKYCHCSVLLRRKELYIICIQSTPELGNLSYAFGRKRIIDAICKVVNLQFWNLCFSETINCSVCCESFMQGALLVSLSSIIFSLAMVPINFIICVCFHAVFP